MWWGCNGDTLQPATIHPSSPHSGDLFWSAMDGSQPKRRSLTAMNVNGEGAKCSSKLPSSRHSRKGQVQMPTYTFKSYILVSQSTVLSCIVPKSAKIWHKIWHKFGTNLAQVDFRSKGALCQNCANFLGTTGTETQTSCY